MDLEVHPVCEYDYLDIYDGPCTSYPRLDRLCGSERGISFVDVTGSYVLIHFHTDSTVQYSGFSLLYYMNYEQDFTNYNPDQGASEEEEEGTPVWVYPVIAVGVLFLLIIISGCVAVRMLNTRKRRVGSAARLVSPQKKLTTHELLTELRGRYGSKDTSSKMKWKNANHPQPNPAGPGVSIINRGGQSPHPAPGAFGPGAQLDNPAYPPMFLGAGGTSMPGNQPVAPALVQGSQGPSGYVASQMRVSPGTVPSPFQYMTPSEARDKGFYGN
ncbi:uncharacterized protein LOC128228875 [Mya arenaria]|uniref:uncharacterized protein LOC128228875 n=1 Tax=Mya arenaria TaxID=6604 RepID=UPI0022E9939E|nr:uncharacterized protein LOC128228875 [Mya arenaria]